MNKTLWEKIKGFFCCCTKNEPRVGSAFEQENFSFDIEEETSLTSEIREEEDKKIVEKQNISDKKEQKVTEEHFKQENEYKAYAIKKLGLSETAFERKNIKSAEVISNQQNVVDTIDDLSKIVDNKNIKQVDLAENTNLEVKEEKLTKIQRLEKIMAELKKVTELDTVNNKSNDESDKKLKTSTNTDEIKNIEPEKENIPIETPTEENISKSISLRNNSPQIVEESLSNSSLSLHDFQRTVEEKVESNSSDNSEITCFIKYYDDKNYSKCLADKMKKHLSKNK